MGTVSTRVPEDLEEELETYLDEERVDRSTGVRKLLGEALEEWRRDQALEGLSEGTLSFAKAAELAGMSVWDFARLAKDEDVVWIADDHVEEDLEAL
jgi:predicted HTH domain antitoxin